MRDSVVCEGQGVFTTHFAAKGTYMCEYGGQVLNNRQEALKIRANEGDHHLKHISSHVHCTFLNSAITDRFPLSYYASNRMLGGQVNDHGGRRNADLRANGKVVEVEGFFVTPTWRRQQ